MWFIVLVMNSDIEHVNLSTISKHEKIALSSWFLEWWFFGWFILVQQAKNLYIHVQKLKHVHIQYSVFKLFNAIKDLIWYGIL